MASFSFQIFYIETSFITVMILSFRTERSRQTVQTKIGLLLEEQSDQGLQFAFPFASFRRNTLRFGFIV